MVRRTRTKWAALQYDHAMVVWMLSRDGARQQIVVLGYSAQQRDNAKEWSPVSIIGRAGLRSVVGSPIGPLVVLWPLVETLGGRKIVHTWGGTRRR